MKADRWAILKNSYFLRLLDVKRLQKSLIMATYTVKVALNTKFE